MLELIQEIKLHTEAGSILEHMELFDILEANAKVLLAHDGGECLGFNMVIDEAVDSFDIRFVPKEIENIQPEGGYYYELK